MNNLYRPNKKNTEILDRAWDLIDNVPYKVSARWVFYRLLQEGYYSKKSDYANKWLKASSSARKAFYKGWRPYTLADETRSAIIRGSGDRDPIRYLESLSDSGIACNLDKWSQQPNYVELWYEARAMTDQFKHYTKHITLRPMGGQPSIPFKWETAKHLEKMANRYGKTIIILYFGDLDYHGGAIAQVVENDVHAWCSARFEFFHCGLKIDQVNYYDVPENPEKPGEYQWEALTDTGAREIITSSLSPFLHHDAFSKVERQEERVERFILQELSNLTERWAQQLNLV